MIRTKLAGQSYFILVSGLLFIGFLLVLVGLQLHQLSADSLYGRMSQLKVIRILNNTDQPINALKQRLQRVSGLNVQLAVVHPKDKQQGLPVQVAGAVKPPLGFENPLVIKYREKYLQLTFSPPKMLLVIAAVYIAVMVLLLILMFYLCYWVIRRIESVNCLAQQALSQLSQNINANIVLPIEHKEVKQLYNDIRQIQNMMQQILQKRTEMLAAISHDLKTPITRLKLRVELLEGSDKKQALLTDIENIEQMLASIITFSKNFLQEENTVSFNLSQLVESLCDDAVDFGYPLEKEIGENIFYHGRMMSIKRAIDNVLDNAIKYGKSGIKVQLYREQDRIICRISDQGAGVDAGLYHKLFEPFYRIDETRNNVVSGSGLGLSITREIIEGHGGKIKLLPAKGGGLVVEITLRDHA